MLIRTSAPAVTYPFNSDLKFAQRDASLAVAAGGILSRAPNAAEAVAPRDLAEDEEDDSMSAVLPARSGSAPAVQIALQASAQETASDAAEAREEEDAERELVLARPRQRAERAQHQAQRPL